MKLRGKIDLTLLIGPGVPVPVPKPVLDALTSVQVTTAAGTPSGFELRFSFDNKSPLNLLLVLLGEVGPFLRTIIIVTVNGRPQPLIDGVITRHQVTPGVGGTPSTCVVFGSDLETVMNLIEFTGLPYPAMPPEARIALIIAKYGLFGMIPLVVPSLFTDVPIPVKEIPTHQGTDLEYLKALANAVGYVFYIEAGPVPGTNIAYWGPEIKVGIPQPALNLDMDAHTNVESLNFSYTADSAGIPVVFIQMQESRVTIPIPIPTDLSPLNPPLGLIPPSPVKVNLMRDTAHLNPMQAISRGMAAASRNSEAVTGSGTVDVVRYGHVLKARGLVGVRGAGPLYNGLYFVKSVTHKIKRGEYKQDFMLTRNGMVSTVPKVPV
jgi:hypothetical protein